MRPAETASWTKEILSSLCLLGRGMAYAMAIVLLRLFTIECPKTKGNRKQGKQFPRGHKRGRKFKTTAVCFSSGMIRLSSMES